MKQIQLLGRVRDDGAKRGGAGPENVNNFIYVCFELVFIICQRQQPDVCRLNIFQRVQLIWFNTLK